MLSYINISFAANNIASIIITQDTCSLSSFLENRLYSRLITTYESIPIVRPSPIEYVSGIATTVINAGRPSVTLCISILCSEDIIKNPTYIKAGAVAQAGIAINIGEKNIASRKRTPVVIAVYPVLPPARTPVDDSTYVVTVETPSKAPIVVAIESERRALPTFGTLPSSSSILALEQTPTSVPTVSKKSTNSSVQTTTRKLPMWFGCAKNEKSTLPAIGFIDSYLNTPAGRYIPSFVAVSGFISA